MDEILDIALQTARDLWLKGWAERNAGNLSVRLPPDLLPHDAHHDQPWQPMVSPLPAIAGEAFLFTGTGSHMRSLSRAPSTGLGVVEMDPEGESFRPVRGFDHGGAPTSELRPHLCAHDARVRASGGADRAVIHTHPPHLIALTYARDFTTKSLTRLLWEMHTECIVVFPEGVGFATWRMPGGEELAQRTAEILAKRPMALWQHHGIVAAGRDLDQAFGLIETAEKAAEIHLKAAAVGPVTRRLSTEQLTALAENFHVTPDPEILG